MNSYHLIDKLSNQYTSREKKEMASYFLHHVQTLFGLEKKEIEEIERRSQEPPKWCTHVYSDGIYRGTKCRKHTKKKIVVVSDPSQPVIKPSKCSYHLRESK